jgi:hypothetical protein
LLPLLSLQPQRHGMELILTADVTRGAVIGEGEYCNALKCRRSSMESGKQCC